MAQTRKKGTTVRRRLTSERPMKLRPAEKEDVEVKKPRQARLPEMEDPAIEGLESAAEAYAEIRDERQALTLKEVALKTRLLDIMHDNKKTEYNHGGVSIKVLVEKEKVRVKIHKDKDD